MLKPTLFCLLLIAFTQNLKAQMHPVTFEPLLWQKDTFMDGSDLKGGFSSNGFHFRNTYDTTFKYWEGFAISTLNDSTTPGYGNQYGSFANSGTYGEKTFAVGGNMAKVVCSQKQKLSGAFFTNSTYSALAMRDGDAFSKRFGGATGTDKDYFRLIVHGYRAGKVQDTVVLHLADYTGANKFIVNQWTWLSFSKLGEIDSLMFTFESSDTGQFGINTPLYFCMDDFNGIAPDAIVQNIDFDSITLPSSGYLNGNNGEGGFVNKGVYFTNFYDKAWDAWSGFSISNHSDTITADYTNPYSSITGNGYLESSNYLTFYEKGSIRLPFMYQSSIKRWGIWVNNSTYTYKTMLNGDAFAKKFGGMNGTDPDYYAIVAKGYDLNGNYLDSAVHFLADFRFPESEKDYIQKNWNMFDLGKLTENGAVRIDFSLMSSDNGSFGMNTPAYFCADLFMSLPIISNRMVENESWSIYPNPSDHLIQIKGAEQGSFEMYDSFARLCKSGQLEKDTAMDVQELPAGCYFIRIVSGNQSSVIKFQKI